MSPGYPDDTISIDFPQGSGVEERQALKNASKAQLLQHWQIEGGKPT